jgi:hypothetical protein
LATSYRGEQPELNSKPAAAAGAHSPGAAPSVAQSAFEFRLYKGPGTLAWFTGAMGGEDYTVLNVRLDITPVVLSQPLYRPLAPVVSEAPAPLLRPGSVAGAQP